MEAKIQIAKQVADKISSLPGVKGAIVDDYNKEGSFQLVVSLDVHKVGRKFYPTNARKFSLKSIGAGIKKIIKEEKGISVFGVNIGQPSRTYDKSYGQCSFDGYEKDYTMVDFVVVL
jgi:hypothetical protein